MLHVLLCMTVHKRSTARNLRLTGKVRGATVDNLIPSDTLCESFWSFDALFPCFVLRKKTYTVMTSRVVRFSCFFSSNITPFIDCVHHMYLCIYDTVRNGREKFLSTASRNLTTAFIVALAAAAASVIDLSSAACMAAIVACSAASALALSSSSCLALSSAALISAVLALALPQLQPSILPLRLLQQLSFLLPQPP
jgi:hypothetical protein